MGALTDLRAIIDSNSNCAAYDFLLENTTTTTYTDRTNNGNTCNSVFGRKFASIDATDGGQLNASGQQFDPTNESAAMTLVFEMKVTPSDTDFFLSTTVRANQFNNPALTVWVDGTSYTTAPDLNNALNDGSTHTVRIVGQANGQVGRTSASWTGYIRRLVVIDEVAITGTDYTNAVAFAETWVGEVATEGTASGSLAFTGSSAGAVSVDGATSGTIAFTGASSGVVDVSGVASGALDFAGSGAGTSDVTGASSGTLDLTGTAAGGVEVQADASGLIDLTGSAVITLPKTATAAGSIAFAGTAQGALVFIKYRTGRGGRVRSLTRSGASALRGRRAGASRR